MRIAEAPEKSVDESEAPLRAFRRVASSEGARQGALALFDQFLASATTFLTMMIIARNCTQVEVGVYSLCFSIVLFAVVLQERALSAPYLVFSHQREGLSAASLLGSTLVHQLILAATVVLAELGYFAYLLATQGFTTMAASVLTLSVVTLPLMLREFIRTVSFSHLRMSSALVVDAVVIVLQLSGLLVLALQARLTVPKTFLVIGFACGFAVLVWAVVKQHPLVLRRDQIVADWHQHWGYARWLVFGRLLGNGSRLLMPWLVAGMLGLADAGLLASCVTLAGLSWVFVRGVNNLLQPRAVRAYHRGGKEALVRELARSAIFYAVFLGGMVAVFTLAGRWLLALLFGPGFADGALTLVLLGLNVLLTGLAMTSSNGLAALQRPKANFFGEGATFLVTLLPAWPLIRVFGTAGAAAAMVAGATASLIIMTSVLIRELRHVDTLA